MKTFTNVFEKAQPQPFKVTIKMLIEAVEVDGTFVLNERTLSTATDKAMRIIKKRTDVQFVNIEKM